MRYKATIYREQMVKRIPQLTFKKKVLIPYDTYAAGNLVVLYFMPETPTPASKDTWEDQCDAQGFRLLGYGRDSDGNVYVRCMKKASV